MQGLFGHVELRLEVQQPRSWHGGHEIENESNYLEKKKQDQTP